MSRRWMITAVIYMMVNAVLFGIGTTAVLSIPTLAEQASTLIWVVTVLSFVLALTHRLCAGPAPSCPLPTQARSSAQSG